MDFANLKRSLNSRHILVPDEWIIACMDWLRENQEPNIDLATQVYNQWLASDLEELSSACLPENLKEQLKTVLQGYHVLQINSIVDVSKPSYQQLTKLKGTDISNSEVSSEKPFEPKCRLAPKRTLMLDLTDGTQKIRAMEYQPIPSLNTNILPGSKILIQGQVPCRSGVLLLREEHIKLLGGEVDELIKKFSQTYILENRLANAEADSVPRAALSTRDNRQPMPADVPSVDIGRGKQLLKPQKLIIPRKVVTEDNDMDRTLDDSMFDDNDDVIFQNVDLENLSSGREDSEAEQQTTSTLNFGTSRATPSYIPSCTRKSNYEPLRKRMSLETPAPAGDDNDFPDDDRDEDFANFILTEEKKKLAPPPCPAPQSVIRYARVDQPTPEQLHRETVDVHFRQHQPVETELAAKTIAAGARRDATTVVVVTRKGDDVSNAPKSSGHKPEVAFAGVDIGLATDGVTNVVDRADSIQTVIPGAPLGKTLARFSSPFSYLSELPQLPCDVRFHFRIKGFVMWLANRLRTTESGWELEVELNDGSASVAALMTNEVLVQLMGMTVEESKQMKASKNPTLIKKRKQMVDEFCERVYNLSCLIDLVVLPGSIHPSIVGFEQVNEETLRQLMLRAY